jgi:hypothetical protein
MAQCPIIGMAGTSPAMTKWGLPTSFAPVANCHHNFFYGVQISPETEPKLVGNLG